MIIMFSSSSKLQKRANGKMQKKWRLFYAMDFESLMYPSFTFCYILGILPYKINASVFEISTSRYIFSTIVICVFFICLLCILCPINIFGSTKFNDVLRIIQHHGYYILGSFIAVVTYVLNGPRMRLLQIIMEISSKLPSKSYQKLSRLIHGKDILGFLFLLIQNVLISFKTDAHIILKIYRLYLTLLIFQMDMLYMNCVCILKACFKRINDNLENMRKLMIDDGVYHLSRLYHNQRSSLLLIELKVLQKQHLMISNAVQMLNMIFSLQLLATIIITFSHITFEIYFHILYWQKGISKFTVDDYMFGAYFLTSITYYFIKITLIVWACETGKAQALQIGTIIHDVLNSIDNNEIKSEVIKDVI